MVFPLQCSCVNNHNSMFFIYVNRRDQGTLLNENEDRPGNPPLLNEYWNFIAVTMCEVVM